jgi:hypothetical protein
VDNGCLDTAVVNVSLGHGAKQGQGLELAVQTGVGDNAMHQQLGQDASVAEHNAGQVRGMEGDGLVLRFQQQDSNKFLATASMLQYATETCLLVAGALV